LDSGFLDWLSPVANINFIAVSFLISSESLVIIIREFAVWFLLHTGTYGSQRGTYGPQRGTYGSQRGTFGPQRGDHTEFNEVSEYNLYISFEKYRDFCAI
jgi:hypothetical protein